jgi:hypothetical protein
MYGNTRGSVVRWSAADRRVCERVCGGVVDVTSEKMSGEGGEREVNMCEWSSGCGRQEDTSCLPLH